MLSLLTPPALHELYAARPAASAAVCGLSLGVLAQLEQGKSALWVRHSMAELESGSAYMPGLCEYGVDPGKLIFVHANSILALLQAGLEGVRTTGLGTVLIEIWGDAKAYDLTASRRLALAAKASGVTVLIARIAARPQPSAAETRWLVRSSPSRALQARAPGPPRFTLSLLRARNGQEGLSYNLEWNRDECRFAILATDAGREIGERLHKGGAAPLSGAVAALPVDGSVEAPWRRAG